MWVKFENPHLSDRLSSSYGHCTDNIVRKEKETSMINFFFLVAGAAGDSRAWHDLG